MLALGGLGAGLSVALLLLTPADGAASAYDRLLAEPLPNVVFVAAAGFGMGVLIAAVWSLARRFLAAQVSSG
jgi:hypothetical protein